MRRAVTLLRPDSIPFLVNRREVQAISPSVSAPIGSFTATIRDN
jgi:hypothetical protein